MSMTRKTPPLGELPLFAAEPDRAPHQPHSATSRAAAAAIEPVAGTKRAQVLAYLRSCGHHGATDTEMQDALDMKGSTQRPRRIKLVELRMVVDSGRTRGDSRQSTVWVAAEYAKVQP